MSELRVYFGETLTSPTDRPRPTRPTRRWRTAAGLKPPAGATAAAAAPVGSHGGGDSVITGPAAAGGRARAAATSRDDTAAFGERERGVRKRRCKVDSFIDGGEGRSRSSPAVPVGRTR